jgi:putative nucleotidyltransferase with HDIG domain
VSETFVFVAVLMFGPSAATMIVVLDTLVISFWLRRRSQGPPLQVAFNIAAPSLAIWLASHVFYWITGIDPLLDSTQPKLTLVVPLLGLATLYFLLNSWLIAFAVAFQKRLPAFAIWTQSFLWLSLNFYSGASVAALLLPYIQQNSGNALWYINGVILPVLLISYLTFKTALGRVEDANKHLSELNRLYISTIETLAMAIDAKDQITHGHIRRVQQYAIGLAKHIGVRDRAQLSAIEAASLLHDMGKLAVPEYILNKPGKLTTAEFERMKLHASVGADILSAIDFPYPVVPIVRHHHENWDGTGYPDRLCGTDIPIGARILSVVDCFDALTSDRPYRPRLSDVEAIQILRERRGSMYDPLVVDAFLQVYPHLSKNVSGPRGRSDSGLAAISFGTGVQEGRLAASALHDIAGSTEEMLVLYELATNLTASIDLSDVGDLIAKHLRRIVPSSLCVFYIHDSESHELVAAYASGEQSWVARGLRIPIGERLSGWVAANKRSIANSDPVLDLGETARTLEPPLRSCLSAPMSLGNHVVGVLTLYANPIEAYSDDHRRILESVAAQIARSVSKALEFESYRATKMRDPITNLPTLGHLERLFKRTDPGTPPVVSSIILVRVAASSLAKVPDADRVMREIARNARQALRGGDLLFKNGADEFVIVLTSSDPEAISLVSERVILKISAALPAQARRSGRTAIQVGTAVAPVDGTTVHELLATARRRRQPPASSSLSAVH